MFKKRSKAYILITIIKLELSCLKQDLRLMFLSQLLHLQEDSHYKQALRNSCELLRQQKELHASL